LGLGILLGMNVLAFMEDYFWCVTLKQFPWICKKVLTFSENYIIIVLFIDLSGSQSMIKTQYYEPTAFVYIMLPPLYMQRFLFWNEV
jgi:hypothetical protein